MILSHRLMVWVIKDIEILPKLELLYSFHFAVISSVKIGLCGTDMGMAHESLNSFKVNPFVQKSSGKGMAGYVRVDSFVDERLFCHRLNQTIHRLWSKASLFIGSMLSQGIEHWMLRINTILRSLQIVLNGEKSFILDGYPSKSLPFAYEINDGLIAIGF